MWWCSENRAGSPFLQSWTYMLPIQLSLICSKCYAHLCVCLCVSVYASPVLSFKKHVTRDLQHSTVWYQDALHRVLISVTIIINNIVIIVVVVIIIHSLMCEYRRLTSFWRPLVVSWMPMTSQIRWSHSTPSTSSSTASWNLQPGPLQTQLKAMLWWAIPMYAWVASRKAIEMTLRELKVKPPARPIADPTQGHVVVSHNKAMLDFLKKGK